MAFADRSTGRFDRSDAAQSAPEIARRQFNLSLALVIVVLAGFAWAAFTPRSGDSSPHAAVGPRNAQGSTRIAEREAYGDLVRLARLPSTGGR